MGIHSPNLHSEVSSTGNPPEPAVIAVSYWLVCFVCYFFPLLHIIKEIKFFPLPSNHLMHQPSDKITALWWRHGHVAHYAQRLVYVNKQEPSKLQK